MTNFESDMRIMGEVEGGGADHESSHTHIKGLTQLL